MTMIEDLLWLIVAGTFVGFGVIILAILLCGILDMAFGGRKWK